MITMKISMRMPEVKGPGPGPISKFDRYVIASGHLASLTALEGHRTLDSALKARQILRDHEARYGRDPEEINLFRMEDIAWRK